MKEILDSRMPGLHESSTRGAASRRNARSDAAREFREELRLLQRGIAASHHDDALVLEKKASHVRRRTRRVP